MPDVTLTYKGQTILELDESGTKRIKLSAKYCEDDITLDYVKHRNLVDARTYFDIAAFLAANPMSGTIEVESSAE